MYEKYRSEFNKALSTPFKQEITISNKSKSVSDRENNTEFFIKRITPQILDVYQKNLPYSTPEEWDYSFLALGGGRSRRTSIAILNRMTWEQFIDKMHHVIINNLSNSKEGE